MNKSLKKRVSAYITAYKDYDALEKCINGINQQSYPVEAIFILDNSPTSELSSQDNRILVEHHPENCGIGLGLKMAIEWASDRGYDFLWTFDQDSVPAPDCLKTLLQAHKHLSQTNHDIGIIAPTCIDPRNDDLISGVMFKNDRFIGCEHISQAIAYECDAPITSGSLLSLAAAKMIAPPRVDLFIDAIDWDYGMRLRQKGFHNYIVPQAILSHHCGEPIKIAKFLGKTRIVHNYSPLRYYYTRRNHTYIETHCAKGWYRITSRIRRINFLLSSMILIWRHDPESKTIKMWACLLGTYHGLIGKLGKTWQQQ